MKVRARTTLGDLQRSSPWVWVNCEKCPHHAPLACAVPVIRWGADVSSDVRERARCTACGHKGATIQHPGWGGEHIGFLRFPVERTARA
jgi:hypothetical protein